MPEEDMPAFLLFLKPEEKKRAQEYVARRLNLLDVESLHALGRMMMATKRVMGLVETGRARFKGAPNAYAKIMGRLYDEALIGYAQVLQQCNRTYAAKERELKDIQRARVANSTGQTDAAQEEQLLPEELRALLLKPTEPEAAAALEHIQKRVQEMPFENMAFLRDATQRLLTWWESTQGQSDGLMLNQFGEVGSVKGRRMIRKRYEEMQQEVLNPFKSWFQNLNTFYMRKRKEYAEAAALGGIDRPR
ncbi:MAG: hypothetical protein EXS64_05055 [Candidatus Latescibacteria bacterium]|nr:hypothetical protein [Candidatus Latescibacterota bacterium]